VSGLPPRDGPTAPSKKIKNIQALRGIAALLVVLFHLLAIERKYGQGLRALPDFLILGASGVDFFLVISGVALVMTSRGRFQQADYFYSYIFNRLIRIFPLYWFYSSLALLVFLFNPQWVNAMQGHQVDLFASFLLLPQAKLPLLAVGWVLIHQLFFYLVFALLLPAPEKYFKALLLLWTALVIVISFSGVSGPSFSWPLVTYHPLALEFIAGCFIGLLVLNGQRPGAGWALGTGVGFWIVLSLIHPRVVGPEIPVSWTRVILFGVPSSLIVYGATALEAQRGLILPRIFQQIGDASYSIYLSHVLVLSALGRCWAVFFIPGPQENWPVFFFMLIVVLLWGFISTRFLEQPLQEYAGKVKRKWFSRTQQLP
jgi:exopolysaccharide production protein ExoZ